MDTAAQSKQPSLCREPIISELVIPDLKEMERSGRYERDVLLWLQDGYSHRAIKERLPQLCELHNSGGPPEEIRRQKMRTVVEIARASYAEEKAAGRGVDLKSYIDAAKTFFQTESARHGGYLQELAEHIQQVLKHNETQDIERHARHAYMSMAKLSWAITHLERIGGLPAALQVVDMLKRRIEEIELIVIGDQPANVGRTLLEAVDKIAKHPNAYIEFSDPNFIDMAERGPWDYEPMHRQSGDDRDF